MAVGANDIALCDLSENGAPAAATDACCDGVLLVAEVIELEYDRIGLAAVRTRMCAEELKEKGRAFGHEHAFPAACDGPVTDRLSKSDTTTENRGVLGSMALGASVPRAPFAHERCAPERGALLSL
jgi:hypothetical protein